jgi:hypothetical protein
MPKPPAQLSSKQLDELIKIKLGLDKGQADSEQQ